MALDTCNINLAEGAHVCEVREHTEHVFLKQLLGQRGEA
jgi:hypothetical protein